MQRLAGRRTWLTCKWTARLMSLYVDQNDRWISARRNKAVDRLEQLVLLDAALEKPKLNALTEKWLDEWIEDKEALIEWCGNVRGNSLNVSRLEGSLEKLLTTIDELRTTNAVGQGKN